jgi:hypothetical protein
METSTAADAKSAAIAYLHNRWTKLGDLDRTRAVHKIHEASTSLRGLAKVLNCSESLRRNLNLAAQAPPLDQAIARKGKISTRELVKRAKAAKGLHEKKEPEAPELKWTQLVQKISAAICDWLEREGLSGGYGEQIVEDARWLLVRAEQDKHRSDSGNRSWSLREGHLQAVGPFKHFVYARTLFTCAPFDPGRSGGEGGKASGRCLRSREVPKISQTVCWIGTSANSSC